MPLTLEDNERLLIIRRRRGETQEQAAKRYNVTPKIYGAMERGQCDIIMGVDSSYILGKVWPHERCLIRRRRTFKTQAEVARQLHCSRWWLNRMERGLVSPSALTAFWSD